MNSCQAGHTKHQTKKVQTILGDFVIYDWAKYVGFNGYCPGQDDVSQTLETLGHWDMPVTNRVKKILHKPSQGTFIDAGCHIGYFSRLASDIGYKVFAYDGNQENLELFKLNVKGALANYYWFNKRSENLRCGLQTTELLKIDIEGAEQYAILYFKRLFEERLVNNVIMEVSPVFNNSYPGLLETMQGCGFEVLELSGEKFNFDYNFEQRDLWLRKV